MADDGNPEDQVTNQDQAQRILYGMIIDDPDRTPVKQLYTCNTIVLLIGDPAKVKIPEINYTRLSKVHLRAKHIRCHRSFADFVKEQHTYEQQTAGALIMNGDEEELDISKVPNVHCPIIVPVNSHGQILLDMMGMFAEDLQCTLVPMKKLQVSQQPSIIGNVVTTLTSFVWGSESEQTTQQGKLKSVLFDSSNELQFMDGRKEAFVEVFRILREKDFTAEELHDLLCEVLLCLWDRSGQKIFETDFPFYVILSYRLKLTSITPLSVQRLIRLFAGQCQQRVEKHLSVETLAEGVNNFIQTSGNWIIQLARMNSDVVTVLGNACLHCLTTKWGEPNVRGFRGNNIHFQDQYVKAAMKWIAIAQKTYQCSSMKTVKPTLWSAHITSVLVKLTPDLLQAVAEGIQFGEAMELVANYQFDRQRIAQLLNPPQAPRCFKELSDAVEALQQWIQPQLVTELRKSHETYFRYNRTTYWIRASTAKNATVANALSEGLDFLSSLQVMPDIPQQEVSDWISFLLGFVDFTKENSVHHVKMVLEKTKKGPYKTHIEEKLMARLESKLQSMNLQTFVQFYESVDILPEKFLKTFLVKVNVQRYSQLTDEPWKFLMDKVASSFPGASAHQFFLLTFKKIGHQYRMKQKFISDILLVDADLFNKLLQSDSAVQEELKQFLTEYIHNYKLPDQLLRSRPWDTMASQVTMTDLQIILLEVIAQEVFPQSEESLVKPSSHLQAAIDSAIQHLCTTDDLKAENPTHYQVFCWKFIGTLCARLFNTDPTLIWIRKYQSVLKSISKIYVSARSTSHQDTTSTTMPPHRFAWQYFTCVDRMLVMIKEWKRALNGKALNYQRIVHYKGNRNSTEIVASCYDVRELVPSERMITQLMRDFESAYNKLCKLLICGSARSWDSIINILRKYHVSLPQDLHQEMKVYVAFPKDRLSEDFKDYHIPEGNSPVKLKLSKMLTLAMLEEFNKNLARFLEPLHSAFLHHQHGKTITYQDVLLYFHDVKSELFRSYLEIELRKNGPANRGISWLKDALSEVIERFRRILNGSATFSDMPSETSSRTTIKAEIELLQRFEGFSGYQASTAMSHFENMLVLSSLLPYLLALTDIFEMYEELQTFSCDAVQKLKDIVHSLDDRSALQLYEATEKLSVVKDILHLKGDRWEYLKIIYSLKDSTELHAFLAEIGCLGESGREVFEQKYRLVTQQLQGEEYQQNVLNQLYAVYQFFAPLFDENQTFDEFIGKVSAMDPAMVIQPLNTVNRNVDVIKLWFSRTEEDTIEKVSSDLRQIISTGVYKLTLTVENPHEEIVLEFKPKDGDEQTLSWNHQKIQDFVCKLGFLDPGEEEESISTFLFFNQTAVNLLHLFEELQDLGHQNCQKGFSYELYCNSTREHVQQQVDVFNTDLIKCNAEANILRDDFKWLLLFTSSNLKQLAELLKQLLLSDSNITVITREVRRKVASLFPRNLYQEPRFISAIEASITAFKASSADMKAAPPDKCVQVFLQHLFHEYEDLASLALPISFQTNLPVARSNAFLHKIQDSSPDSVLKSVLSIYQKLPHSFQLLHCKLTTTEREVELFFKRIMMFPGHYVFVEVNRLSSQLEEVLLKLYMSNILELNGTMTEVHFIETAPSVLEAAPWLDDLLPARMEKGIKSLCCTGDIGQAQLLYGLAGDGKTHYIKEQLQTFERHLTVVINEAFSIERTIEKLNSLPDQQCAIHFNFTIVPPRQSVDEGRKGPFGELMEKIGRFMFDLLALGYIEDDATGTSFTLPGGFQWNLFIEVSSMVVQGGYRADAEKSLENFLHFIPICKYLCESKLIDSSSHPYTVDRDVQLVAKYLKALDTGMINKLFTDDPRQATRSSMHTCDPVRFGNEPDLSVEQCHQVLERHMPDHIKERKISQKMFIGYMKRRCEFLDNFPGLNYNVGRVGHQDTTKMGSTLVKAMLKEVTKLCDPRTKEDWSSQPHQQLIYEFQGGGGSIGWICLYPDQIPKGEIESFQKLGIKIKTMKELYERETLDHYLTRALNIPLTAERDGLSRLIDESEYVLTTDYTLKMLNINECFACGVPVIIEGETGVGKTALLEMLSKLWNYGWLVQWKTTVQELASVLTGNKVDTTEQLLESLRLKEKEAKGKAIKLREFLVKIKQNPVVAVLRPSQCSFGEFWSRMESIDQQTNVEIVLLALRNILTASVSTFHKLNVHASLQPADIRRFFNDVFCQAKKLQECSKDSPSQTPKVTAYLDEINTSSCAGLFKEILVDRSIDGKPIPENIFLVAACNPLRGTGISLAGNSKLWHKPTYYVQQLHPTLEYLKWDYGALNDVQEEEYVNVKMRMINSETDGAEVRALCALILESQKHVREYSCKELDKLTKLVTPDEAKKWSRSAVSQRDMQRVFTFYSWLLETYKAFKRYQNDEFQKAQAVLVALGIVYYMRLSEEYRRKYAQFLDEESEALGYLKFTVAFKDELDWFAGELEIPQTIAKTNALKENLLANIVCCETRTPLIIIGEPGTSKTLSFNLTVDNLKGKESKCSTFRKAKIFPGLDPIFYQCSHHTTSNEVEKIFSIAIRRQTSHTEAHLAVRCVVFMDEAGLPEERHESLKVLHFHLDRREVSFVAITNHALDAAKTNRAITLYRPQTSAEDLKIIAETSADILEDNEKRMLDGLCDSFRMLVKVPDQSKQVENGGDVPFDHFYGQRDFIHFVNYLRRNRGQGALTDKLMLEAVERNLNGHENFDEVLKLFFTHSKRQPEKIGRRNVLEILKDSLQDHPEITSQGHFQESVRYKLIIDSSDDESAIRLLFAHGILEKENTRMYVCSEFLDESHMHINIIAGIKHSAGKGHTVLMCQTDQIHECFYELFNQRFRVIEDPKKGTLLYTNISIRAHTKPCRVHPNFQCVVVIKKSELKNTPTPFLNRFEKYYLSYSTMFGTVCSSLPPILSRTLRVIQEKVMELIDVLDQGVSLYGYSKQFEKKTNAVCHETLYSLMLSLLPPQSHQRGEIAVIPGGRKELTLLATAVQALISYAGFQLPQHQPVDVRNDSEELIAMLSQDEDYKSTLSSVNDVDIERCVRTAMEDIHDPHCEPVSIEKNSRLVIALISQWLVRYLARRVLQLLTPEGLLKYHSRMPHSYISVFLDCEQHFSLKAVVENQLNRLDINHWKMSACATKLVCYTRSSQHLLALPASLTSLDSLKDEVHAQLKELVYSNVDELMILTITTTLPESKIKKQLKLFASTENLKVLLVMCNMRDISKTMINHLRILIEQKEDSSHSKRKLYVLLLHFPPTRFFDVCYQALFLNGWDHFYIDLQFSESDTLSIKQCFQHCLSGGSHKTSTPPLDFTSLLPQIIPALSFRVVVGHPERAPFNKQMSSMERQEFITKLFELGTNRILISLFNEYWKPSRLKKCLQEAVTFTFSRDSSLSIANYVYTRVRRSFTDFIVYMITAMNEGCTLDIVLGEYSETTRDFFLDFIPLLNRPKFADLRERSRNVLSPVNDEFKFPFFHRVYQSLEYLVDECRSELQTEEATTGEGTSVEAGLYEKMKSKLLDKLEACEREDVSQRDKIIGTAISAMCRSPKLKNLYFSDFAQYKLRLSVTQTALNILETYFNQLETSSEDESHPLVSWLARIHTYSVDLKWIMAMNKISPFLVMQMDSQQTIELGSLRSRSETDLATYIITTVHGSLTNLLQSDSTSPTHLHDWKEAYLTVVQMASLYEAMQKLTGRSYDKFNHSHLTFLTLHTQQSLSVQLARELFHELEGIELLSLRHAAPTCIKVLKPHMKPECLQSFVEQLLSHYFFKDDSPSDPEDCQWFLKDGLDTQNESALIQFISPSLYKLYLAKLLGRLKTIGYNPEVSRHFKPERRQQIGELLAASTKSEVAVTLANICSSLQRRDDTEFPWLVKLYFLVAMEKLDRCTKVEVKHAERAINRLTNKLKEAPLWERSLLVIEKEAVLQKLLKVFARSLCDPERTAKMIADQSLGALNAVFEKENEHECGLHLCFYLWKHLNNITEFRRIMTEKLGTIYTGVNCLREYCSAIAEPISSEESESRLMSIINPRDQECQVTKLYREVHSKMLEVYNSSQVSLLDIAIAYSEGTLSVDFKLPGGSSFVISKRNAFRMCLWLCAFFEFYDKKVSSQRLADDVKKLKGQLSGEVLQLICCFVNPSEMIHEVEQEISTLVYVRRRTTNADHSQCDPIHQFFTTDCSSEDRTMKYALANMVAVVLGCEDKKCPLWYHLFAPNELAGTFTTGYMYDRQLGGGYCYDCGVQLSEDGELQHSTDYVQRATKKIIELNALYSLIMVNYGAFCLHLLTQRGGIDNLRGEVLSAWLPIRHHCIAELNKLWLHSTVKLGLSPEQISLLIICSMQRLMQACYHHNRDGIFREGAVRDDYERMWNNEVFKPSLKDSKDKFAELTKLKQLVALFAKFRNMDDLYPRTLDLKIFRDDLGGQLTSDSMLLDVLSQFSDEYKFLKAIGAILPSLIEFYQWLHTDLAYMVTVAKAGTVTIQEVVLRATRGYSNELKQHYIELHEKVQVGYNEFVEVSSTVRFGGCGSPNTIEPISKETSLLHFLSDKEEEGEGNDCLFVVIDDMIKRHNEFLTTVCNTVHDSEGYEQFKRYIPKELQFLYPAAVSNDTMIIRKESRELLEVMQSHYILRTFDFSKMQEDIVTSFVAGKPKFEDPSKFLRMMYRFKKEKHIPEPTIQPYEGMLDLPDNIPASVKEELPEDPKRKLDLQFHSADYNGLLQVSLGLKMVVEQLIQARLNEDISLKTLPELINKLIYYDEQQQHPTKELFEKMRLRQTDMTAQGDSLTPEQYQCLEDIPAKCLYPTLERFVKWIRDGVYDFHALPLTMKRSMSMKDEEFILGSDQHYQGVLSDLQEKMNNIVHALGHSENHFRTHMGELSRESIIVILSDHLVMVDDTEKALIPETVLVEQYVSLRICLRRLCSKLEEKMAKFQQQSSTTSQAMRWSEFIHDLWTSDGMQPTDETASVYSDGETESEDEFSNPIDITQEEETIIPVDLPSYKMFSELEKEMARRCTPDDIADYLRSLKLDRYVDAFTEEYMDGNMMLEVDEATLCQLGVVNDLERDEILTKFKGFLEEKLLVQEMSSVEEDELEPEKPDEEVPKSSPTRALNKQAVLLISIVVLVLAVILYYIIMLL